MVMTRESVTPGGHWSQLQPEARRDGVHRELRLAVLANEKVQSALVALGPEPPVTSKWKLGSHGDDEPYRWHVTRTRRAQRIYLIHIAVRGLLTCAEIDHYASVIEERRRQRVWPKGQPPPSLLDHPAPTPADDSGAQRGPSPQTVALAASALGDCVAAARGTGAEKLDSLEKKALYRTLEFLGLERRAQRQSRESGKPAAVKKRRQRGARARAELVAAEREHLDREVAAGRLTRVSEQIYVGSSPASIAGV